MNIQKVNAVSRRAQDFLARADEWKAEQARGIAAQAAMDAFEREYGTDVAGELRDRFHSLVWASAERTKISASLKRGSLDLTRSLAEMRSRDQ